jgi:hypothetical protein
LENKNNLKTDKEKFKSPNTKFTLDKNTKGKNIKSQIKKYIKVA